MTREEAIKGFEDMKKGIYPFYPDEYIDMAIKALEQVPKLQNRCYALTQGQMCLFCPYECERRIANKRESESEDTP